MEDPQESGGALFLCLAMVHCWGSPLVKQSKADPWNVTFCLSCHILGFALAFVVLRSLSLGTSYYVVSFDCFVCVCCVGLVVSTSQVIG